MTDRLLKEDVDILLKEDGFALVLEDEPTKGVLVYARCLEVAYAPQVFVEQHIVEIAHQIYPTASVHQRIVEVAHQILYPTASVHQRIVEVACYYWGAIRTQQHVIEIAYQPGADIYGPSVQHI